jgi:hypothetical protein
MRRSTDLRVSWGVEREVADLLTTTGDGGRDQFSPTVAVAPNGGALMVGHYSRANDPADLLFHRRSRLAGVSTSTGAVSWAAQSFQLGPDTPVAIGQGPAVAEAYMGDYDQIATSTGYFHASWSDNRDGNAVHQHQPDVFYARVAQTPATTDPPCRCPGVVPPGGAAGRRRGPEPARGMVLRVADGGEDNDGTVGRVQLRIRSA